MTAAYAALLLADGRLPSGAHTQSAGVEPAVTVGGLRTDQIPDYLRARLRSVTEVEAATAVVARAGWLARPDERDTAMAEVDEAWRVRTPSAALREASDLLGRSYLRTAGAVWDLLPLTNRQGPRGRSWCRPVVVGATAAETGLSAAELARLVAYEDVQSAVAAAVKLDPFDPTIGVRWTWAAAPEVEALVDRVQHLRDPADIPAWSAFELEEWAEGHRTLERRLFRA